MERYRTLALALSVVLAAACEKSPVEPLRQEALLPEASAVAMTHANAKFQSWHQGFNHGTAGWIDSDPSGPAGWCGTIDDADRRDGNLVPSAGRGYALVTHGACNAYWAEHGFPNGSGPYSPGAGYSTVFPDGGFVMELDIYLDPAWTAAEPFTYSVSMSLLDQEYPDNFRYFMVPLTIEGGTLSVAGHPVREAGWYTFRHRFSEEAGKLAVDFELARHGRALFTVPVTETAFSAEPTASFDASNVGNGYVWFVAIAPGLRLAIDEHQVRQGR